LKKGAATCWENLHRGMWVFVSQASSLRHGLLVDFKIDLKHTGSGKRRSHLLRKHAQQHVVFVSQASSLQHGRLVDFKMDFSGILRWASRGF